VKALAGTFNQEKGLLRDCEKFGKGSFEALFCRLLPAPALAIRSNLPRPVRTLLVPTEHMAPHATCHAFMEM